YPKNIFWFNGILYILIDSDNNLLSVLYSSLKIIGGSRDFILHKSFLDSFDGTAHCIYIIDVLKCRLFHLISERFNEEGSAKRVNRVYNTTFIGNYLLGAERYFCCVLCRQGNSFV